MAKENKIKIGNKKIGDGCPTFIIAEIGKNFIQTKEEKTIKEYLNNAKELIRLAQKAGADAVKFQTHNVEDEQLNIDIISPHFSGSDRYGWIRRNDLATPLEFWQELKKYCEELGIIFFSTPMSRGAAIKLEKINVPLWKIGSGDVLDFVMLDFIADTKKPIIISSGMSVLEEIDKTIDFLQKKNAQVALLHCVSKYPCPPEELNLKTIEFFKKRYDIPIGFSDHSIGYESAIAAAVNLGAAIIEKHFSLDRNLWGADHKVSMTPEEFKEMVKNIRNKKKIKSEDYGQESKVLQQGEAVFRPIFHKSLMAGQDIKKGTIITKEMVYAMRPQVYAGGLPSKDYERVLGKITKKDLNKYDPITPDVYI
ncbi:MAG: N-acetylneuraminate synthase family protein [Patescibacteria group bacterium]